MLELVKLALGIPPNVNVIESAPALPTMFKPAPDDDANVSVSAELSANTSIPLIDIVANDRTDDGVKYPASLFNCDMLLPDTTTFFQVAIYFPILL
jgi:hypothetical protein